MAITVSGTTITFNDGTTQTTAGGAPTTDQVLTATAGASFGAVGTYAVLMNASATTVNAGGTIAGSSLRYNSEAASRSPFSGYGQSGGTWGGGGTAPSGTWRAMARSNGRFDNGCNSYTFLPGFFLRIS